MKAALIVHRVFPDTNRNLATIATMTHEAADAGAELVVVSEAALTGFTQNDDPAHDLPLGQTIPGPGTELLATLGRERRIWLAIGLLEREAGGLYDSAVLLTPTGEIGMHYRRIQPNWHGRRADPAVYHQGTTLSVAETPFGRYAFLLCGDLFDDEILRRMRDLRPDWLLLPFARGFDSDVRDREQWYREEQFAYVRRARLVGVTTLMVNYLADRTLPGNCFGGAMVVSGGGIVLASLPLGEAGMLLVDL